MHLEEFAKGTSFIHYLDPRVKTAVAAAFSIVAALADRLPVLAAAVLTGLALIALARLPWKKVARRLAVVNAFIVFLWLFLPFSHNGRVLLAVGPFEATAEGVMHALTVTLKANAIILAAIALLATSTVFAFVHALRHMYLPEKLVSLFFLTFRYFQVIHQEYLRLRTAMKMRGFKPRTNLHTYRSVAWLLGMLLVRSFDRSERVYQAMLCRGYDGRLWLLSHFHLHRRDYVFLTVMISLVAALAAMQWTTTIL